MIIDVRKHCEKCGCNARAWTGDWEVIDIKSGKPIRDIQYVDERGQFYISNGELKTGHFYLQYKGLTGFDGKPLSHEDYPEPAKVIERVENGRVYYDRTPSSAAPNAG
jgi:hypothetical protein